MEFMKNLFGGKKDGDDNNNVANTPEEPPKKKKKKKRDMMSSILSESVWGTVLDDFRGNEAFATTKDGEDVYVGLLLNSEDIGGINKKSAKNEAIGSIVECINGGRIRVFIDQKLMEEEQLIIIPDDTTLEAMDEFSVLVDAPYKIVLVHPDGVVDRTDVDISYEEAKDVREVEDYSIDDLLFDKGFDWVPIHEEDEDVGFYGDEDVDPMEEYPDELGDEDAPFGMDEPGDDEYMDEPSAEFDEKVVTDTYDSSDTLDNEPVVDDDENLDPEPMTDDYEEEEDPVVISEDSVEESIKRVFYSDDLGLEISTEPFDFHFLHGNTYIPFDEDRGDGWLNSYVEQMAKDANLELEQLHKKNILEARGLYYDILSGYCEKIMQELDEEDPNTEFGEIALQLKQLRIEAIDDSGREISERKDGLKDQFHAAIEGVREEAAISAEQAYRARHSRQHEEELRQVESQVHNQIEAEYDEQLRALHEKRRKEAQKRLDLSVNEALKEVMDFYRKEVENEQDLYRQYRQNIQEFIDENRKNDVAHTEALAEDLRQTEKADAVMAEYQERLQRQAQQYDANIFGLRQELDHMSRRSAEELNTLRMSSENRISDMRDQRDNYKDELNSLRDRYELLDDRKEEEYQQRLAAKDDRNEALLMKYEDMVQSTKRNNVLRGTLAGVGMVAFLAIGIIFGLRTNISDTYNNTNTVIEESINDRLDKLEEEKKKLLEENQSLRDNEGDDAAAGTDE